MKRIITVVTLLAVLTMSIALFAACGSSREQDERLVGTWDFLGMPAYYVLNANGSGTMDGEAINWWTDGNTLYVCVTPSDCGNRRCSQPWEWRFTLSNSDNNLNLRSLTESTLVFDYTRAN